MLELKNITYKVLDKTILNDIDLMIDLEKKTIITGSNGSGKSTLLKIIMGIITPSSGSIILDGIDITHMSITERSKYFSYSFQNPVTFKGLTVADLIKLSGGSLDAFGLSRDYLTREYNNKLSGGELKKLELSSLDFSKYLILDEPEAGIDLWSFNNLIEVFFDKNFLMVTHQPKLFKLADEIIILDSGEVSEIGTFSSIRPCACTGSCPKEVTCE